MYMKVKCLPFLQGGGQLVCACGAQLRKQLAVPPVLFLSYFIHQLWRPLPSSSRECVSTQCGHAGTR